MSLVELSLHKDYVPDWGLWEGCREIFQNAMDENDNGHKIFLDHSGDTLSIGNNGSHLTIKSLLIGYTTKSHDSKMRGEKGEGLDLGLLALVRSGYKVVVRTPTEIWRPFIGFSDKWGQDILFIDVNRNELDSNFTEILVSGISKEDWSGIKFKLLDFHDIDRGDIVDVENHGSLLLNPEYSGMVYSKGIFVQKINRLKYGYNFFDVRLDRDRKMVDGFDLGWEMAHILNTAIITRPDLSEHVWDMLMSEAFDTSGFSTYTIRGDVKNVVSEMFLEKHGEDAVVVSSTEEVDDMDAIGRNGVIVPKAMREVVSGNIDTPYIVKEQMAKAVEKTYSMIDLSSDEYDILTVSIDNLQCVLNKFCGNEKLCIEFDVIPLMNVNTFTLRDVVRVVQFRSEHVVSRFDKENGVLNISRFLLKNKIKVIKSLVRETARMLDSSMVVGHLNMVESIWCAILCMADELS
jgi:hypothetical protein